MVNIKLKKKQWIGSLMRKNNLLIEVLEGRWKGKKPKENQGRNF